jgi:hypothetical protein
MKLQDAKSTLENSTASVTDKTIAGWSIADSPDATFNDLLQCLKHRGQIAEAAMFALYKRTKRPRANDSLESFVRSHDDWAAYLKNENLI